MRFVLLTLLTFVLAGCNSEARVGTRNLEEIGKHLATSSDPATAATGKVIAIEAAAIADNYDQMLFGLWNSRSTPSVTAEDLADDLEESLKANLEQAKKIAEATKAKVAIGNSLMSLFGLILGGSGAGALAGAGAWVLANRSKFTKLQTAFNAVVDFGVDMTKADTTEQAEAVKDKHVLNQKALGVHDLVKPALEKAKKRATVG